MEDIVKIKKGHILITEGDKSTSMYLLKSGLLKVYKDMPATKGTYAIRTIEPGEIFGELSFIDGKERSASVKAVEDCEVYILDYSLFKSMLGKQPKWIRLVMKSMSSKIRDLSEL
ncbi:MAG: cyclic nucleotide-binding domain-containing protein [Bacteriovoracaceae bacterium]|jgi:CRP-like cAMP-binding protein|nr:cyclic nucleotide-binding domain-containing protein [Bacteriovoracaceae bacterium]